MFPCLNSHFWGLDINDVGIDLLQLGFSGGTVNPQQDPVLAILVIKCLIVVKSTVSPLFWLTFFSDKMHPAPPSCCQTTIKSRKKLTFPYLTQCHHTQIL